MSPGCLPDRTIWKSGLFKLEIRCCLTRKNGTYDYRYTDPHGKVRCVYAKTLESLREKEAAIQRDFADGIDYAAGEITVSALVDRYMSLKRDVGHNTLRA